MVIIVQSYNIVNFGYMIVSYKISVIFLDIMFFPLYYSRPPRIMNWIFKLLLSTFWSVGKNRLEDWWRRHRFSIHGYHGLDIDGNNSKKFLSCSKNLTELLPTYVSSAITDLLKKFNLVISGCFSYYLAP